MGITLDFAFDRTSSEPVDSSLVLSKAEMLAVNDNMMPDTYFAVCKDDKKFYIYDKSATPSAETGKFTELKGGGGGEEGKTYTMDWDESTHELTLTDGTTPQKLELVGLAGQVDTMPTVAAGDEGKIVQYIGATDTNYTNGYFYECVEVTPATDPKTYEWVQKNVQAGGAGGAEFKITTSSDSGTLSQGNDYLGVDLSDANGPTLTLTQPGTYVKNKTLQEKLVSGTNIKTVANQSLLGSGDVEFKTINNSSISGSGNLNTGKVTSDYQTNSISIYEGTDSSVQISKDSNDTIRIQGYGKDDRGQSQTLYDMSLANKGYVDTADANLQTQIDDLGEPFRVKNWAGTFDVTIEPCTTDKTNAQLAKMTFTIDATEGADYQIVGMIAYEVFDAASGGNRLNVWPVCQFTGNGQKELSVRWVCAGTTAKTAKRINAWVLLKHR